MATFWLQLEYPWGVPLAKVIPGRAAPPQTFPELTADSSHNMTQLWVSVAVMEHWGLGRMGCHMGMDMDSIRLNLVQDASSQPVLVLWLFRMAVAEMKESHGSSSFSYAPKMSTDTNDETFE